MMCHYSWMEPPFGHLNAIKPARLRKATLPASGRCPGLQKSSSKATNRSPSQISKLFKSFYFQIVFECYVPSQPNIYIYICIIYIYSNLAPTNQRVPASLFFQSLEAFAN